MADKKVVFTKEIDSKITGTALVLALLICGIVLQFSPVYFGNKTTTETIKWIFIGLGIVGVLSEMSKLKTSLIGFDNVLFGIIFIGGWFALFWFGKSIILNSVGFVLLLFGSFGFFQGIQQIIYSLIRNSDKEEKTPQQKESRRVDVFALITKSLGVLLIVVQIVKAVLDLSN